MPAYNESKFIVNNILETVDTLAAFKYDFEVIVVDDGSPDNTYQEALKARLEHPERVRIVRYDENQGKGNALICGTRYATGEVVVFLDADMDLHPIQLPTLLEIMAAQGADFVIGSKRHPLSRVDYPPIRRLYSTIYYFIVRLLFGLPVRDTQTGLKVVRMEVLRNVFPRILVKRFAFDLEMLTNAHRLGYRIAEAPVTLEFRRVLGRINWRDAWSVLLDTAAIYYRMHIRHYYDRMPKVALHDLPAAQNAREVEAAGSVRR